MNEQAVSPSEPPKSPRSVERAARNARGVALICLAGMAATIFFVSWPEFDLVTARLFFDDTHRFFLERHPVPRLFNTLIDALAVVLIVSGLGGMAYTGLAGRTLAGHGPRAFAFIVASVVVGPGLVANTVFKNEWGRARPRQIVEFGGGADFTPALAMADQCARNCSFVAGDASLAFALLAVALLAPQSTRARWIAAAVFFGAFIGFIRIVQGAHFLSDVVFAGIFVSLVVLLLKGMIFEGCWGGAAVERALAPQFRLLSAAVRRGAANVSRRVRAPLPEAAQRLATAVAKREFWLRMLPGLKELGLIPRGAASPSQRSQGD
jgi:lipid A 4'-phosphatase